MVAKLSPAAAPTVNQHKTTTTTTATPLNRSSSTTTSRPPLLPSSESENNNNAAFGQQQHRRPKAREVTSRYMSTSSSSSTSAKRSPSPSIRSPSPSLSRPVQSMNTPAAKRSLSVERKRTATPTPTTLTKTSSLDLRNASGFGEMTSAQKMLMTSMRSFSVSFQGESFSLPVSRVKPAPNTSSARKSVSTPERRRVVAGASPARNVESVTKQIEQQQRRQLWPGRSREADMMSRSFDSNDGRCNVVRALKNSFIDCNASFDRRLWNSNNKDDAESSLSSSSCSSSNSGEFMSRGAMVNSKTGLKATVPVKLAVPKRIGFDSPVSSPKGIVHNSRGQLLPVLGMSPSRVRSGITGGGGNVSSCPSMLSFAADVRREKVGEVRIANAYVLRLLHNRLLQWRFVNARADATLAVQKMTVEKSLYNAWVSTSKLCESVRAKRSELQMLRHNLKLASVLKNQMIYLEEYALTDHDYSSPLLRATEALRASTLRLPVVAGARVDVQKVKDAIGSAVDVMQAMASSICSLLSKVGEVNSLMDELSKVVADEHNLLGQSRDILSTIAAMQVQDCSTRVHMIQMQPCRKD